MDKLLMTTELLKFDCVVLSVGLRHFYTRIENGHGGTIVEAEFPISTVPKADRNFLLPGAFFTWYLYGSSKAITHTKMMFNKEKWTSKELTEADEEADALFDRFKSRETRETS